jgi:hypothetical protein
MRDGRIQPTAIPFPAGDAVGAGDQHRAIA